MENGENNRTEEMGLVTPPLFHNRNKAIKLF